MYERILRSTQNVCLRGGNKGSNFVLEINFYNNLHIWPPPVFLALRVWEGIEAIQDDKYLNWY